MLLKSGLTLLILLCAGSTALAHSPLPAPDGGQGLDGELLPSVLGALVILLLWLGYCMGALRVPPGRYRWLTFQLATLLMVFTVFGPLDELAETSTAMHMTQHMLMMAVIPPLLVLARPLPQWTAAIEAGRYPRQTPGRPSRISYPKLWGYWLRFARYPFLAACIHAAVVWFWHAPRLYMLALDHPWWHLVEHACFLLSAGLLWWAVLRSSQRAAPHAMLALLFTLMHTGFLGALLSFGHTPLYGASRELQDQQLAGLIMWVLGGLPYLAAAGWCALRWFQQMQRRLPTA